MSQDHKSLRSIISTINGLSVFFFVLYVISQHRFITDLWWQLKLGDEIRLRHAIPTHDEFSWTSGGRAVVLHEWGSYLAFAEAFRHLGGWSGVWLLQALMATLIVVGLYLLILRRIPGHSFVAMVMTVFAAHACGSFFAPRPQLFTYVCLLVSMEVLLYCLARGISVRAIALLAAVQILWANTHAAGPIYIVICLTYALANVIQAVVYRGRRADDASSFLSKVAAACACGLTGIIALAVNPSGWRIYQIIFDTVGNKTMPSTIAEWLPVNFHDTYGQQMEIILFFVGFVLASSRRRKDLGDIFTIGVLVLSALYALRNIPILMLAGSLIITPYVPDALQNIIDRFKRLTLLRTLFFNPTPMFGVVGASLPLLVYAAAFFSTVSADRQIRQPILEAIAESAYQVHSVPEDGCRFLETEKVPTSLRLYNNYDDGAYLIWRVPEYPVFSSTETFVYFGPVLEDYFKLDKLPLDWRSIIAPYNIGLVLTTTADGQARLFLNASDWALIYAGGAPKDDLSTPATVIFVRRTPANLQLIQRCRKDCSMVGTLAQAGYLSAQ